MRDSSWPSVLLREIASDIKDGTHGTHPRVESGIPFLSAKNITPSGQLVWSEDDEFIDEIEYRAITSGFAPRRGDLLVTVVGSLGRTALFNGEKVAFQRSVAFVRPNSRIVPQYLLQASKSGDFLRQMERRSNATAQAGLYLGELAKVRIPLPAAGSQQRIAEILSTVDEVIEQTEALIAKTQQIKAGLMQDLFTRGVTSNGHLRAPCEEAPQLYKESPLGCIPKEWEIRRLADLCGADITYGIVQAGPHIDSGIPYIRTGDMTGDRLVRDALLCTSPKIAAAYKRSEVRAGEIVCAIRATVGKVLPVPEELDGANLTQGTARLSPKPSLDSTFLLWAMRASRTQSWLATQIKGTTFNEITLANLRLLPVALPVNQDEQAAIAAHMTALAARIAADSEELEKLLRLKRGLMHDLLTGRVAVTVASEAEIAEVAANV